MKIIVTGSSGLIGSSVVEYFSSSDNEIFGFDNNSRATFFGIDGDTRWNQSRLEKKYLNFNHIEVDIRDRKKILDLIKDLKPDAIIHAAAQPSHDRAADIPFDDFDTNAVGTINLLEAVRRYCINSPFIFMSTNKVYGDRPNFIKLKEMDTRWEFNDDIYINGISEEFNIDNSKHSLFGASKVAADIMVQEYGKYFDMPTCVLRGGCLTGPNHSGVQLHGFLSYLIKCNLEETNYTVFGYQGKQVRDNIHSYDVANFMKFFIENPKKGEVYNLGGGKSNSISILETFTKVEKLTGKRMIYDYDNKNREGDHICYYSNLNKLKKDYPLWSVTKNLDDIFLEIVESWNSRIDD